MYESCTGQLQTAPGAPAKNWQSLHLDESKSPLDQRTEDTSQLRTFVMLCSFPWASPRFTKFAVLNRSAFVDWIYADLFSGFVFALEFHFAVNYCKKRIVSTNHNVVARVNLGSSLTNQNVAGTHYLTIISFDAQSFGFTVASISGTANSFFMSHDCTSQCYIFKNKCS